MLKLVQSIELAFLMLNSMPLRNALNSGHFKLFQVYAMADLLLAALDSKR